MPDPSERRRFPRCPVQLPVQHSVTAPGSARNGVGWTRDLSQGGACLELDERLSAPTPLQIHLQTDRGAIEVKAQVVWEVEARGSAAEGAGAAEGGVLHGVAFTRLASDQLQALRNLLLTQEHERRAGVRLPVDLAVTCQPGSPGGVPLEGRTGDMSRGGLLLRLSQAVPPGTSLELTLHRPDGQVTAEGEIVWVEPPERRMPGEPIRHGLRFSALGWSRSVSLALLLTAST